MGGEKTGEGVSSLSRRDRKWKQRKFLGMDIKGLCLWFGSLCCLVHYVPPPKLLWIFLI